MKSKSSLLLSLTVGFVLGFASLGRSQGTAFTYQGVLTQNGASANGTFDIQFELFTAVTGGSPSATTTNLAVGVTNGLFTTTLDFSNAFNGTAFWLDIAVLANGTSGAFTELTPRQQLTATPYALFAPNAGNVTGIIAISNLPPAVVLTNSATVTNSSATKTGYLFAYDLTTQNFPSANNYTPINFSVPGTQLNGWTLPSIGPSANNFTATISGLYLIQYQAQITGPNGAVANIKATLNSNNAEIAGSQGAVTLAGTNGVTMLSRSFIAQVNSNDVFKLQFAAPATGVSLAPNGTASSRPSVSLTVVKIN